MVKKTVSPKKQTTAARSSAKTTKKPVAHKATSAKKSASTKTDFYPNRATFYTAFFAVAVLVLFALLMVPR